MGDNRTCTGAPPCYVGLRPFWPGLLSCRAGGLVSFKIVGNEAWNEGATDARPAARLFTLYRLFLPVSHFWSLLAARRAFFFLGSLCLLCAQATQLALYGTYSQQRPPHECQLPDLGRIEDRER